MTFEEEHRSIGEQIDQLAAKRAYAPHCDARVLHRPGSCWSCDGYPDWQSARITWRINFTGEHNPEKLSCPAELDRPVDVINRWGGNRPDGQTFDEYLTDLTGRARQFGEERVSYIQPVPGEDYSVTVAKHFGVEVATPVRETRLQYLRRRVSDFIHFHF